MPWRDLLPSSMCSYRLSSVPASALGEGIASAASGTVPGADGPAELDAMLTCVLPGWMLPCIWATSSNRSLLRSGLGRLQLAIEQAKAYLPLPTYVIPWIKLQACTPASHAYGLWIWKMNMESVSESATWTWKHNVRGNMIQTTLIYVTTKTFICVTRTFKPP